MTRKEIYNKWVEACKAKDFAYAESKRYTDLGNEVYHKKYNNSFKDYDEINGDLELDGPWEQADVELDKVPELEKEIGEYYQLLLDSAPEEEISELESSGNITYGFKKIVKIKMLDGEEAIGIILPWEGDYSGSPWFFSTEDSANYETYLNIGEFVDSVEFIEDQKWPD